MSRLASRVLPGFGLFAALTLSLSASPAIGLVVANGSFQLDHSRIWGNATLFDGNVIETDVSSSQLQLHNGVKLGLAADSRARVYESRLLLEKGMGELNSGNYRIEAAGLRVSSDGPGGAARVQLTGPNRVIVAARAGAVRVANSNGILIARLASGREMAFEPQEGSAATLTKVSGVLALKDGKFILIDQTTNVTIQLQGEGLEAELGNQVDVTGTADSAMPTVAGASQIINVTSIKRRSKGAAVAGAAGAAGTAGTAGASGAAGTAGSAGAAGAAGGAAAGTAAGLSTAATVAIVGGVAAAGTVGGLAAAGALPGQGSSKPPTSR